MTSPDSRPDRSAPARDLGQALGQLRWTVEPGTYGLAAFPRTAAWAGGLDSALLEALGPHAQVTLEPETVTVLAEAHALAPLLARFPGARQEADLAWIRFEVAMAWDLVGFLALVCTRLAEAGVPLGVLCSYDRDHLFIARRYLDVARPVLDGLSDGLVR